MQLRAQPLRPKARMPSAFVGTAKDAFKSFARGEGHVVKLSAKDNFFIFPDSQAAATPDPAGPKVSASSSSSKAPSLREATHGSYRTVADSSSGAQRRRLLLQQSGIPTNNNNNQNQNQRMPIASGGAPLVSHSPVIPKEQQRGPPKKQQARSKPPANKKKKKGAKAPDGAMHGTMKVSTPGSGRSAERTESLKRFRQKRQAVWPLRQEPYASAAVLHFATDHQQSLRWLTHFYSMLWFEGKEEDRHFKRLARDALRYRDEVHCLAARIVRDLDALALALQKKKEDNDAADADAGSSSSSDSSSSSSSSSSGGDIGAGGLHGRFSTFHIRRGDFQFKKAKISVGEVMASTGHLLLPNELVYVATDDADKSLLDPIRAAGHEVRTLGDFLSKQEMARLANPDWVGMVEQVVASRGRIFVGTYWSTFTGYIVRMRGYRGLAKASYYALPQFRDVMVTGKDTRRGAGWWREWPEAWEGIDDIDAAD